MVFLLEPAGRGGAAAAGCEDPQVRITSAKTYTVGNPWKNWVFVRLETDEGSVNFRLNSFVLPLTTAGEPTMTVGRVKRVSRR